MPVPASHSQIQHQPQHPDKSQIILKILHPLRYINASNPDLYSSGDEFESEFESQSERETLKGGCGYYTVGPFGGHPENRYEKKVNRSSEEYREPSVPVFGILKHSPQDREIHLDQDEDQFASTPPLSPTTTIASASGSVSALTALFTPRSTTTTFGFIPPPNLAHLEASTSTSTYTSTSSASLPRLSPSTLAKPIKIPLHTDPRRRSANSGMGFTSYGEMFSPRNNLGYLTSPQGRESKEDLNKDLVEKFESLGRDFEIVVGCWPRERDGGYVTGLGSSAVQSDCDRWERRLADTIGEAVDYFAMGILDEHACNTALDTCSDVLAYSVPRDSIYMKMADLREAMTPGVRYDDWCQAAVDNDSDENPTAYTYQQQSHQSQAPQLSRTHAPPSMQIQTQDLGQNGYYQQQYTHDHTHGYDQTYGQAHVHYQRQQHQQHGHIPAQPGYQYQQQYQQQQQQQQYYTQHGRNDSGASTLFSPLSGFTTSSVWTGAGEEEGEELCFNAEMDL